MNQSDNLPLFEQAYARRTDPSTSHSAAKSVVNIGRTRDHIIRVLRVFGPLADEEIIAHFHSLANGEIRASQSGIRSRRSELVKMGLVERAGSGTTGAGRVCTIWRLKT